MSFISLNLISLLLILLMALFFSTQGVFSSLLSLVMAFFSAALAMGLGGSVAGIIPRGQIEYAQGIGFLATFVLAFVALRVVSEVLLPKNIALWPLVDKIAGGVVGLLTSLIIMGTVIVGLEMMPFGTTILGNDRFETPDEIKDRIALGKDASPEPRIIERALAAKFVTGLFYITDGGSLGGRSLDSVHPDLGAELTKKRHTVWADVRQTLDRSLISVPAGFWVTPEKLAEQNITVKKNNDADRLLVIRTVIDKSNPSAKTDISRPNADTSFDVGDTGYFDVTAAQVRMVAKDKKGAFKDYSPIGFLDHGVKGSPMRKAKQTTFQPLDLASGLLVEDYTETESEFKAVIEWVFEIPDDADPQFIEVKRGGVVPLTGDVIATDKNYNALAADMYPPREDRAHQCALTIKITEDGKPKKDATVWIVDPTVKRMVVNTLLNEGNAALEKFVDPDSTNPWPDPVTGGVPNRADLRSAHNAAINVVNKALTDPLPWEEVMKVLYYGQSQRNGVQMVSFLKNYFSGPFTAVIDGTDLAQSRFDKYVTDSKGTHAPTMVRPGEVMVIVVSPSAKAFRVWVIKETIKPAMTSDTIELGTAAHPPTFETDTTAK